MPREAKAPFNNAKADIVLHSSDNVYFRVFRCMLALASPFFDAMFDLPQPRRNGSDNKTFHGIDVIQVSENSRTLDMLLRFCYPATVKDPSLEDMNDVEEVLGAAMKYGMEEVEERVRKAMFTPPLLESNPERLFAIACRYGLGPEARTAARYSLHRPASTQDLAIARLPDDVMQGLAAYRSRCSHAAKTLCNNLDWLKKSQTHSFYEWWTNCCPCDSKADVRYLTYGTYPRQWWADYMDETSIALEESPSVERASSCPSCRRRADDQMVQFAETLARELDKTIAKIPLDIAI
ncbi:hypothetical protein DFH29DRAFT_888608 [Suillus ampliporus]|nr:hypothetical protein DFH29DRAFT_888608 [Suillus ampliporus]